MSRRCELTGQKAVIGNRVSNANNRSKTRHLPSLKRKRLFLEPLNQNIHLNVSSGALRTIDKCGGLAQALLRMDEANFSDKVKRLKKLVLSR